MSDNQVSEQAFAAEGVDTLFTLMGDANMYWSTSMADNHKVRLICAPRALLRGDGRCLRPRYW